MLPYLDKARSMRPSLLSIHHPFKRLKDTIFFAWPMRRGMRVMQPLRRLRPALAEVKIVTSLQILLFNPDPCVIQSLQDCWSEL